VEGERADTSLGLRRVSKSMGYKLAQLAFQTGL
jgi:hypothetical protein